jgi:hypothetical protein
MLALTKQLNVPAVTSVGRISYKNDPLLRTFCILDCEGVVSGLISYDVGSKQRN